MCAPKSSSPRAPPYGNGSLRHLFSIISRRNSSRAECFFHQAWCLSWPRVFERGLRRICQVRINLIQYLQQLQNLPPGVCWAGCKSCARAVHVRAGGFNGLIEGERVQHLEKSSSSSSITTEYRSQLQDGHTKERLSSREEPPGGSDYELGSLDHTQPKPNEPQPSNANGGLQGERVSWTPPRKGLAPVSVELAGCHTHTPGIGKQTQPGRTIMW